LPPLRERREDIPLLVDHFLRQLSEEMGREPPGVGAEALSALEAHEFPGNVRELKNLVEYALIRSRGGLIRPEHLRFIEFRDGQGPRGDRQGRVPAVAGRSSRPEESILSYVGDHGSINNAECRRLLSIDLQRASYLLKKLHTEGVLEKHGERRWSRYSLPSAGPK
jgi:DNA-binding NtrC family response regulator